MSEKMPEKMPGRMPERLSGRMSEYMLDSDRMFQMVCQKLCKNSVSGRGSFEESDPACHIQDAFARCAGRSAG